MQEIVLAIITACGGALVTGLITLISQKRSQKQKDKERDEKIQKQLEEVKDAIKDVQKDLKAHIQLDKTSKADEARTRILRFGDEVKINVLHTQEHWNDILRDIDRYEHYCDEHHEYVNSQAVSTITFLRGKYAAHLKENNFLD